MEKILIDLRDENKWIKEAFNNADMVTVERMLTLIEDLLDENEALREVIRDMQTPKEEEWVIADDWYEERNS